MLTKNIFKQIEKEVKKAYPDATTQDILFVICADAFDDTDFVASLFFNALTPQQQLIHQFAQKLLQPHGIGMPATFEITKEENKQAMVKLIQKVQFARDQKRIRWADALKIEQDIRTKLNDKFDMESKQKEQKIIVVPQKHDIICPHTNRQCTFMPTKEACIQFYKLKDT